MSIRSVATSVRSSCTPGAACRNSRCLRCATAASSGAAASSASSCERLVTRSPARCCAYATRATARYTSPAVSRNADLEGDSSDAAWTTVEATNCSFTMTENAPGDCGVGGAQHGRAKYSRCLQHRVLVLPVLGPACLACRLEQIGLDGEVHCAVAQCLLPSEHANNKIAWWYTARWTHPNRRLKQNGKKIDSAVVSRKLAVKARPERDTHARLLRGVSLLPPTCLVSSSLYMSVAPILYRDGMLKPAMTATSISAAATPTGRNTTSVDSGLITVGAGGGCGSAPIGITNASWVTASWQEVHQLRHAALKVAWGAEEVHQLWHIALKVAWRGRKCINFGTQLSRSPGGGKEVHQLWHPALKVALRGRGGEVHQVWHAC
eukprot:356232-Chlamydomonas_euryale.AAC.2